MKQIEKTDNGWSIRAGGVVLDVDEKSGCLSALTLRRGKEFEWTRHPGDVTVRDDLLRRTYDRRNLEHVQCEQKGDSLRIRKHFRGAPWVLHEVYTFEDDAIAWNAEVVLDKGDYRSCAISSHVPWPQPVFPISFWAARENMPSAPNRFAGLALEYGEVTSGIMFPALACYIEKEDVGLLLTMPFDFMTPRFRFLSGYRDPDLEACFDWLALAPGKAAKASLLLTSTPGNWRPALGWLYERFKEYFEPRSKSIHSLWGGHISGGCNVALEEAQIMADLGLTWHEVHVHFPCYGNYHPEGVTEWRSGHALDDETRISIDMIRRTIENLHAVGAAALPYIQVSGDGDEELLDPAFTSDRIRDWYGNYISAWRRTWLMNSDPALPFGKDMVRQIRGMVDRYPEMDGVFLDQACYNFPDTAHDDGITAVNNRPCYMTGFNYFPHLELLSSLLHPGKSIIANGPYGIGIMKYIDGFMAEGSGWLCDHFQYYGLAKPMFFLVYKDSDRDLELMFQRCLIYAAGFTSYPKALPSKDLYDRYLPLLRKLFGRTWFFDADPLQLPTGFEGNLYRKPDGNLIASLVSTEPRAAGRSPSDPAVRIRTSDMENIKTITIHRLDGQPEAVNFTREDGAIQFDVPDDTVAGVVEVTTLGA